MAGRVGRDRAVAHLVRNGRDGEQATEGRPLGVQTGQVHAAGGMGQLRLNGGRVLDVVQRRDLLVHLEAIVLDAVDLGLDALDHLQRVEAAALVQRHVQAEVGRVAVDRTLADQAAHLAHVRARHERVDRAVPPAPQRVHLPVKQQTTIHNHSSFQYPISSSIPITNIQ